MVGDPSSLVHLEQDRVKQCVTVRNNLIKAGLYRQRQTPSGTTLNTESAVAHHRSPAVSDNLWRIAATPFPITKAEHQFLKTLGNKLLAFYEASNRLYFESLNGQAPVWVAALLNQGKPESVVEFGRMNRFKQQLPQVIRPDLIPTNEGMIATELDSVPGGIGLTAALSSVYSSHINDETVPIGTMDQMVGGFERMIRSLSGESDPFLVIVVSEESADYRPEMFWLATALRKRGLTAYVAEPKSVNFSEEGLWLDIDGKKQKIDILYRFFELFDLKNIPKSELFLYAAKKKRVLITPPPKAHLEEKLLFSLFHHPQLQAFWLRHLGKECHATLMQLFPKTWILDPAAVPHHAVIPDLTIAGHPVSDFRQLGAATKKEREFVVKPSGFSELAWGSRGVSVGHDLSSDHWRDTIAHALNQFQTTPYILQKFHKGKKVRLEYVDFSEERILEMNGRVRLSPYYFVEGKEAHLGGILATVCSLEKKLIHGMVDAVMVPCAVTNH